METVIFELEELTSIEQEAWRLLEHGIESYKNPFHNGTVANIHNGLPELRTVILRKVLAAEKKLFFHTDIRSPKVQHLQQNGAISWLFYDEPLRLQMRMKGTAIVHIDNDVAAAGWAASRLSSQLTYSIIHAPGAQLAAPLPININEKNPPADVIQFAATNFSVVETTISQLDVVFLHHQGNKRAIFDYENNTQHWVQA
jgi:pyridoxamine 5'-phosphate oxidase